MDNIIDEKLLSALSTLKVRQRDIINFIKEKNRKGIPVKRQTELAKEFHVGESTISKDMKCLKENNFIIYDKDKKEYCISSFHKSITAHSGVRNFLTATTSKIYFDVKTIFIKTESFKTQLLVHLLKDSFPTEILSISYDEGGILLIVPDDKYDKVKSNLNELSPTFHHSTSN